MDTSNIAILVSSILGIIVILILIKQTRERLKAEDRLIKLMKESELTFTKGERKEMQKILNQVMKEGSPDLVYGESSAKMENFILKNFIKKLDKKDKDKILFSLTNSNAIDRINYIEKLMEKSNLIERLKVRVQNKVYAK